MDEPTNHLDIESIVWLERFLKARQGALLMTSHDRDFMNRVVSRIAEIDDGEIVMYSGNYDFYEREREIRDANREAAYARQQAMLAKEQRFIDRFAAHAAKAAQVQSRVKALDKIEKVELPKKRQVVRFDFRTPLRSGDQVAVLEDLTKTYGRRTVHEGLNLTIRRGERWSVMGRNGAGKSTLLKMVAGHLTPDRGQVRLGASLNMGYFAQQSLDLLQPDLTVEEQLQRDFPHESIGALRNLAGAFQFSGDDIDKKIRSLLGGEKTRLVIARMLLNLGADALLGVVPVAGDLFDVVFRAHRRNAELLLARHEARRSTWRDWAAVLGAAGLLVAALGLVVCGAVAILGALF
jgi:ATPase subunit of ABC transporter with duplicated ATPase domains